MFKKFLAVFLLILANLNIVFAKDLQIKLSLDKNETTTNEIINFSISAKGIDNIDIENIYGIENFDIIGSSQSSTISIVNGNADSNLTFNYSLKPKKEGKIQLGPIKINKNGKEFESNSVFIEVKKGKDSIFLNPTIPNYPIRQDEELQSKLDGIIQNNSESEINIDYEKIILGITFVVIILIILIIRNRIGDNYNKKDQNLRIEFTQSSNNSNLENLDNKNIDVTGKILLFIQEKYNIDINGKTHSEIIELISTKDSVKGTILKEIFDLINEVKYSKNQNSTPVLNELIESFLS